MDRVLDHYGGATRDQIVSRTVYMVGVRRNAAAASEGDLKYFGDHRPAATVLGVTEPAVPGQVMEIAFVVDMRLPAGGRKADRHGPTGGRGIGAALSSAGRPP